MDSKIRIVKEISTYKDELRIEYINYAGDEEKKRLIEILINKTLNEAKEIMDS